MNYMLLEKIIEKNFRDVHFRIAEIRIGLGLNQESFSAKVGVPLRSLQYWESDNRAKTIRRISLGSLFRLAAMLGLDIAVFFQLPKSGKKTRGRPRKKIA